MKIDVAQAKKEIGGCLPFCFHTSAGELDINSDEGSFLGNEIKVEGTLINDGTLLDLNGKIFVEARYTCDRCLEEFYTQLEIPFGDKYKEANPGDCEDELESACFVGDEIDITDLVRENLLLAQPLKKLCKENCKGLCSKCGVNLNVSTCSCDKESIDPRLMVLQQLLNKK